MTCPNPSHTYRIESNMLRRMSPFSSYATVMMVFPICRAVCFIKIFSAIFLAAFIITFVHDVALLNIEENISRRLLDAGAFDENGVAGADCVFLLNELMNLSNTNELASGPSTRFSTIVSPVVYWNTRCSKQDRLQYLAARPPLENLRGTGYSVRQMECCLLCGAKARVQVQQGGATHIKESVEGRPVAHLKHFIQSPGNSQACRQHEDCFQQDFEQ
jgi:hypothetical protein